MRAHFSLGTRCMLFIRAITTQYKTVRLFRGERPNFVIYWDGMCTLTTVCAFAHMWLWANAGWETLSPAGKHSKQLHCGVHGSFEHRPHKPCNRMSTNAALSEPVVRLSHTQLRSMNDVRDTTRTLLSWVEMSAKNADFDLYPKFTFWHGETRNYSSRCHMYAGYIVIVPTTFR